MKKTTKMLVAKIISLLPLNFLRVIFYKTIFKYKIINSKVGFGTIIVVDSFDADSVFIGRFNKFSGPMIASLKKGVRISDKNQFICGSWLSDIEKSKAILQLNKNVNVTCGHYFDVNGGITISDDTWIAGKSSQFWTHGAGQRPMGITIGSNCYIGSSVLIPANVNIANGVTVALGSVVVKNIDITDSLIGGNPAKVIRTNYKWNRKEQ
tara:strand:+ start:3933 stop:4559 length:627 start_codon:yes stop_codon:yes gene_type:complete